MAMVNIMLKRRKTNGFTLIELVVVIAILGILAGIAILRLLDTQKEARRNACLSSRTILSHELAYQEAEGVAPADYFAQVYTNAGTDKTRFHCPSGGTYSLNATTLEVTCSEEDHKDSSIGAEKSTGGVDVNKLKLSSWSAAVKKAQASSSGLFLYPGTVYSDTTGTYFIYSGDTLSNKLATTNPSLEAAVAAGFGIAKINMDTYLTSQDQAKEGNKTVWTSVPSLGTVYYDTGTDSYYVYHLPSALPTSAVNITTSPQWLKISK